MVREKEGIDSNPTPVQVEPSTLTIQDDAIGTHFVIVDFSEPVGPKMDMCSLAIPECGEWRKAVRSSG